MWTRAELKENAKAFFKFNYWKMVLVAFIVSIIGGGGSGFSVNYTQYAQNSDSYGTGYSSMFSRMSPQEAMTWFITFMMVGLVIMLISTALSVFLFNPLMVGADRFFVVSHYQKADLNELGYAFSNYYMNVVKVMFLRSMYVFLWSLLFVIPGIIKAYEYIMIPYILAENPGIDSKEAFAMSKQMMDGNKWNTFVLRLSFFGWVLLGVLFCGIPAIFYVNPYMLMTHAELYVALKEITFGGRGQNNNQWNGYQPNNNGQWNNNNDQWNNNQWNGYQPGDQWNNSNNQWNANQPGGQWNNSNNQWNGNQTNGQWNDNNRWNNNQPGDQWNNNSQWNSNQPGDQWNNGSQWNNNQPTNSSENDSQQTYDPWDSNTPT